MSISHQGNTWEPRNHLIGDKAVKLVDIYLAQKKANQAAADQRQKEILEGNRALESGQPSAVSVNTNALNVYTVNSNGKRPRPTPALGTMGSVKSRVNESPFKSHFYDPFWDTTAVPAAKRALCNHCNKTISAASSTNMKSHLAAKHRDVIVKELAAHESLDPSDIQPLKSLKADFNGMEKFKDGLKKSIDEQYVKICCKKQQALSIGESDRELKVGYCWHLVG